MCCHPGRGELWFNANTDGDDSTDSPQWHGYLPFCAGVGSDSRDNYLAGTAACCDWHSTGGRGAGRGRSTLPGNATQPPG